MRISDWSSDVCSSDLADDELPPPSRAGWICELVAEEQGGCIILATPCLRHAVQDGQPAPIPEARSEPPQATRSEEHTSELQSLMRISYAVFCLKKKTKINMQHLTKLHNPHKYQANT